MNRLTRAALFLIFNFLGVVSPSLATVRLPMIFGDNMVLQQGQEVSVWGWAEPDEDVTVEFQGQAQKTVADEDGQWSVNLSPLAISPEPATMTISGSNTITYHNILVGEVWLCSGQSNMEWPVNRSANPDAEAQAGDRPLIRHIKVPKHPSNHKREDFKAKWQVATPETVPNFTAVGYYFARTLVEDLNVPVGLINASWGGTRIEPWINREGLENIAHAGHAQANLKQVNELDTPSEGLRQKISNQLDALNEYIAQARESLEAGHHPASIPAIPNLIRPNQQGVSRLYRGMVHPLVPFGIRGVIWYQGESNAGHPTVYTDFTEALVTGWRDVWGQGDFPFYWVQLANFRSDQHTPDEAPGWALLREAQTQALKIPNTGMAVIIDIGDTRDIHPKNKQDVGKRLAQWALTQDYGKDGVPGGPLYKSHEINGNEIHISFDHVGKGLMVGKKEGLNPVTEVKDGKLERFIITGSDMRWVWADARIEGDTVILSSPEVPQPTAARYAFSNNPLGANLYNRDGFPAAPFRTDR